MVRVNTRSTTLAVAEGFGFPIAIFLAMAPLNQPRRRVTGADCGDLLRIALDCGFSSKASFARVFREHTGLNPSAWKAAQIPKITADRDDGRARLNFGHRRPAYPGRRTSLEHAPDALCFRRAYPGRNRRRSGHAR